MDRIKVTKAGYDLLIQKKDELIRRLRQAQTAKGLAAAGDSNSWHDNSEFELHAYNEMMLNSEVAELIKIIDTIQIVGIPAQNDTAEIGHVITLLFGDGIEKTYKVGGHGEGDLYGSPPRLSYTAPLISQFIGQQKGYSSIVLSGGKQHTVVLTNITISTEAGN